MWRAMIVQSDAPILRAASMNVRCLSASVLPRTSRANVGTLNAATATITGSATNPAANSATFCLRNLRQNSVHGVRTASLTVGTGALTRTSVAVSIDIIDSESLD